MKKLLLLLSLFGLFGTLAGQECASCETMICDGVNCDDGSSADGVQTSRKCSCGSEIQGACAYVELDLTLNPYFDPNDPSCELIMRSQESGNFNIYYLDDSSCSVTDCQSPDFTVSSDESFGNIPSNGILRMYVCKNGGNAGRRDFTFSISCSTIENCSNQIDDDLDQWTDCEDPDCLNSSYCSYTETSSAADGGLESNSNLSQKIAKRNYLRSQTDQDLTLQKNQPLYMPQNITARSNAAFVLSDAISQEPIKGAEARVSSSEDLIAITNAIEVFSTDIYLAEERVASVLATKSENSVYEHSKYICDRLNGASIEKVVKTIVSGVPVLITKFVRTNGIVEYNTNFSFFKTDDKSIQWESYWTLADYSKSNEFYNYQIWANNVTHLASLITDVAENIQDQLSITSFNVGNPPPVLINTVWYEQQKLWMKISNPGSLSFLQVSGEVKRTEDSATEIFSYEQTINSDTLVVDMGGSFAIGVTLTDPTSEQSDAVYFADGSWGLDFQPGDAFIHQFEIAESKLTPGNTDNERAIERDILIRGTVKNSLAIYRSLNAAFAAEDLQAYNFLTFSANGKSNEALEVVFVREGIDHWEDQPRALISLGKENYTYWIDLNEISAPLNDLRMIVFKYSNYRSNATEIEIRLSETKFTSEKTINTKESLFTIAPNPIRNSAYVSTFSESPGAYRLTISTLSGQNIYSASGLMTEGLNMIPLNRPSNTPNGIYLVNMSIGNKKSVQRKIVFE